MRKHAAFVTILALLAGLAALVVARPRAPYTAPREIVEVKDAGSEAASSASSSSPAADAQVAAAFDAEAPAVKPLLDRPLRVSAAGWELLAPGVADEKPGPELTVELASGDWPETVQARLARGGADPQGADVVLVPLPELVQGYEKLRALDPKVFHVVGFSRGKEELRALKDAKIDGEVRVGAWDAAGRALALFVLDGQGIQGKNLRFLAPTAPEAKGAPYMVQLWSEPSEASYRTLVSTAEASRLVPIVAVAARANLEKNETAFRRWIERWQAGQSRVKIDAPEIARLVAQQKGAPDAASIVERLGRVESVQPADVATLLGAGGERAPLTIETLFNLYWALFRGANLLTAPPPTSVPVVTQFVPRDLAAARTDGGAPPATLGDGGAPVGAPLFVFKIPEGKLDDRALGTHIAVTASIFDRFAVRVSGKAARALVTDAQLRFAVEGRIFVGQAAVPAQTAAVLEIVPR